MKETSTEILNLSEPNIPKLLLHKKNPENTFNKKQTKLNKKKKKKSQKQIFNISKYAVSRNNPKQMNISIKFWKKKKNLSIDTDALSLHPTDSSENEEIMSVASDSIIVNTFI